MRYRCPKCNSKKPPRVLRYFPPKMVKCVDCFHENFEKLFIKEDEKQYAPYPEI